MEIEGEEGEGEGEYGQGEVHVGVEEIWARNLTTTYARASLPASY